MRRAGTGVLVAWCLLAPGGASAQEESPADPGPAPPVEPAAEELPTEEDLEPVYVADFRIPWRLVIGFDFGIGIIDATCGNCYALDALVIDAFAGVQVAPRFALLADLWSSVHLLATDGRDRGVAGHTIATLASRAWIVPRLWVQLGGGSGWLATTGERRSSGPAAVLAVGGEPGHKLCRGVDMSLRLGGTLLEDEVTEGRTLLYSVAAVVGFHWN